MHRPNSKTTTTARSVMPLQLQHSKLHQRITDRVSTVTGNHNHPSLMIARVVTNYRRRTTLLLDQHEFRQSSYTKAGVRKRTTFSSAPRVTSTSQNRQHNAVSNQMFRSRDRKSTRLNSSHLVISYAVFCLKKKKVVLVR